jgi:mono/diheme cytochrome c family protein
MSLFQLTKFGLAALIGQPIETDMPAFDGKLSDEEIWAALAYIKLRWPQKIQQRQADINKRAEGS